MSQLKSIQDLLSPSIINQKPITGTPSGDTKFGLDVNILSTQAPGPSGLATEATLQVLLERLPESLGQKAMDGSISVTLASDQSDVPVSGNFLTDPQLRAEPVPATTSPYDRFFLRRAITVGNIKYTGLSNKLDALTSEYVWKIFRESSLGGTELDHFALNDRGYVHRFDDYLTLFDTVPNPYFASIFHDGATDHSTLGNFYDWDRTTARSCEVWFRIGANTQGYIISKIVAAAAGWSLEKLVTSNALQFIKTTGAVAVRVAMTAPLLANTWYQAIITDSGSGTAAGVKIYINAVNQALSVVTDNFVAGSSANAAAPLNFGGRNGVGNFSGNLAPIRFFNKELSQAEATELYNGGMILNITSFSDYASVLSAWAMGSGDSFPTLTDLKGIANATMVSMVAGNIVAAFPGSPL